MLMEVLARRLRCRVLGLIPPQGRLGVPDLLKDCSMTQTTYANKEVFELQARICKAFAHPARLRILHSLGEGELGSSELQNQLGLSKTNISQHLAILKSAGVLSTRRVGKQIYCSLTMPEIKQACELICQVLQNQISESHRLIA